MRRLIVVISLLMLTACKPSSNTAGLLYQCKSGEKIMQDARGNEYVSYPDNTTTPFANGYNYETGCKIHD